MGYQFKEAQLGLASAYFAAGDFSRSVIEQVKPKTSVKLTVNTENVAGVKLPIFAINEKEEENTAQIGMTGGGQAVNKAKEAF
jgi:vacuolar-type H+-ATPase subunit D/Vma8